MKTALEKLYFFLIVCSVSGAIDRVFGGHSALQAGGANTTSFSSGDSDPMLFLFSAAVAGLTLVLAFGKAGQIFAMLIQLRGLAILYLFTVASLLWSADRAGTFRSSAYLLLYLVASAYLALRFSSDETVLFLANSILVLGLLSIAGEYLLPATADPAPGWTGIFPQKNDLGVAMATGIAAWLVVKKPWNLFRFAAIAVCAALLVLSQSFTSVLGAVAVVAVLLYARFQRELRWIAWSVLCGGGLLFALAVNDPGNAFTRLTGKDLTLTGRTLIWEMVIHKAAEHPFLGFGYGAFWTTQADAINQFSSWKPGQAHNGYLDLCLNLGIVGLLLLFFLVHDGLRRSRRLLDFCGHNAGKWMLAVSVLLLVRNCAEASFLDISLIWTILLLSYFSAWKEETLLTAHRIWQSPARGMQAAIAPLPALPRT